MGFFNNWKSHYAIGFAYGLALRVASKNAAEAEIMDLDIWAWDREWEQNLKGKNPNNPMSEKQVKEARAWGEGARKARGVNPPFPIPPYPEVT